MESTYRKNEKNIKFRDIKKANLSDIKKFNSHFVLECLNNDNFINIEKIFSYLKRNLIMSFMTGNIQKEEAIETYARFLNSPLLQNDRKIRFLFLLLETSHPPLPHPRVLNRALSPPVLLPAS